MPRISRAGTTIGAAGSVMDVVSGRSEGDVERAGQPRPTRSFSRYRSLRLVDAAVGVGAGLERAVLHAGERGIEGRLDLGAEQAGRIVERRRADPVVLRVEQDVAGGEAVARNPDDG